MNIRMIFQGCRTVDHVKQTNDIEMISTNVDDNNDHDESKANNRSPSPRRGSRISANAARKREASSSPSINAPKKVKASPRNKQSLTSTDDGNMDVDQTEAIASTVNDSKSIQTPPKKARTSGNRKTPTSTPTTPDSSDEYVRKLRPRK
jgi:hypothetical protein